MALITNKDIPMESASEMKAGPPQISSYRWNKAVSQITLLRTMLEIDNMEVKRLISQLESPDYENWTMAEECIKQKLAV